jgi:hypothetical protein
MDFAEAVRRAQLTVVIAELCQIGVDDVLSPVCPGCDEGPAMALPGGQMFCGNDNCDVLTWLCTDRPETFKANAVAIEEHRSEDGRITWKPRDT